MSRYLLGVLLACATSLAAALWMSPQELAPPVWRLTGLLLALPLGVSWIVAECVERWSPRRAFDPRLQRGWTLLSAGLVAGVTANVLTTVMLALVPSIPDAGTVALCSASAAALEPGRHLGR